MQAKVQKWGNSLAIRIPKALAEETGLHDHANVNLTLEDGRLVIEPLREGNKYLLEELLLEVNDSNLHGEYSFGESAGREKW